MNSVFSIATQEESKDDDNTRTKYKRNQQAGQRTA